MSLYLCVIKGGRWGGGDILVRLFNSELNLLHGELFACYTGLLLLASLHVQLLFLCAAEVLLHCLYHNEAIRPVSDVIG